MRWPYSPLETGKCIVPVELQVTNNLKVGDQFSINILAPYLLQTLAEQYNRLTTENDWTPYDLTGYETQWVNGACEIQAFIDSTYGKYSNQDTQETIIMEYDNFLLFALPYFDPAPPDEFKAFVEANPGTLLEY